MRRRLAAFAFWQEAILIALLAALVLTARSLDPSFLNGSAQLDLASHAWELALLAVPMTLIIITAGVDLSIGSIMALSAVVAALLNKECHIPIWPAAGIGLLVGILAGAVNGIFIAYVRVHPLIVTLATLAAYRGVAEGISHGDPISDLPPSIATLTQSSLLGLPPAAWIFLLAALAAFLFLRRTTAGRALYAIGHNETATRYCGIRVARIKLLLYTSAGALAALAGILFISRRNTAKADIGNGLELDVITVVLLGGSSIFGGRGGVIGTLLGVTLIHEVREFLSWQWNRNELHFLVMGALLILSVFLNRSSAASPQR